MCRFQKETLVESRGVQYIPVRKGDYDFKRSQLQKWRPANVEQHVRTSNLSEPTKVTLARVRTPQTTLSLQSQGRNRVMMTLVRHVHQRVGSS
jgi:hypothetical protein